MNNFYRGGRGLVFFKYLFRLFKSRNNRIRTLFCFGLLICFMLFDLVAAQAQSPKNREAAEGQVEVKPLEIGDTIPEQLWNLPLQVVNHPTGKDTITLNNYRDKKLIILDFWATWCAPCVRSLEQVNELYPDLPKDVQIIPISYENEATVSQFLNNRKWEIASVSGDKNIRKFFSFQAIPFVVWIKNRRIFSQTGTEYTSASAIDALLADRDFPMLEYESHDFDKDNPVDNNNRLRSFEAGAAQPARIAGSRWRKNGFSAYNLGFIDVLSECYATRVPGYEFPYRIKWQVPDSVRTRLHMRGSFTGNYESDQKWKEWLDSNTFCYRLQIEGAAEKMTRSGLREILTKEVRVFFEHTRGITFDWEKETSRGYVVQLSTDFLAKQTLIESDTREDKLRAFKKVSAVQLLSRLRIILGENGLPLESNLWGSSSMEFWSPNLDNVSYDALPEVLRQVGIDIQLKDFQLDLLVIKPYLNKI